MPQIANLAVWALALPGGALINIGYAAWSIQCHGDWAVLRKSWSNLALSALIGVHFFGAIFCYGTGCQRLGATGAAVGFGVYQAMMIVSSQTLGILCGEWRGVPWRPRLIMAAAVILLLTAVILLSAR